MNTLVKSIAIAVCAVTVAVSSANAQEAQPEPDDWTLTVVPNRKATIATIEFSTGLSLAARCINGVYDLLITGLPDAPRADTSRELGLKVGEETELKTSVWTVGTQNGTAFSRLPAIVARRLAKGGELQILVPAAGAQRRTRYVMALDPSSTALEQTLKACDRPLIDPRDNTREGEGQEDLPDGLIWTRPPRPQYPFFISNFSPKRGYAALSCVTTAEGRATDCQIESEQPPGYGFGRAALNSLDAARLNLAPINDGRPLAGRLFAFTIAFRLD